MAIFWARARWLGLAEEGQGWWGAVSECQPPRSSLPAARAGRRRGRGSGSSAVSAPVRWWQSPPP